MTDLIQDRQMLRRRDARAVIPLGELADAVAQKGGLTAPLYWGWFAFNQARNLVRLAEEAVALLRSLDQRAGRLEMRVRRIESKVTGAALGPNEP
ncbi:MAG: hypothetical protein AAGN66_05530 [Acidobacteriota bacterium]